MILIQILTTLLMHFLFRRLGECTFWAHFVLFPFSSRRSLMFLRKPFLLVILWHTERNTVYTILTLYANTDNRNMHAENEFSFLCTMGLLINNAIVLSLLAFVPEERGLRKCEPECQPVNHARKTWHRHKGTGFFFIMTVQHDCAAFISVCFSEFSGILAPVRGFSGCLKSADTGDG